MNLLLAVFLVCLFAVLAGALAFHALARLGSVGRAACDACAKAPLLDVIVFLFCHGPHLAATAVWLGYRHSWIGPTKTLGGEEAPISTPARWAWREPPPALLSGDPLVRADGAIPGPDAWLGGGLGLLALLGVSIAAQAAALVLWSWFHEAITPGARSGPRIVTTLNRRVGPVRNHLAVWWTALAVPLFTLVRLAQILIYPPLHWLVRLPRYKTSEWINVSRQKFSGLVGYDLIWCLYCDWMTGVWSLGSEMLRNVESFWCPIRYSSPEKCEKCVLDFPDIDGGWVDARGSMADVARVLEQKYPGPNGENGWFGHPTRVQVKITIDGQQPR